jgi:omega-6 fatty acid desaturase (delta-12 desaturase)
MAAETGNLPDIHSLRKTLLQYAKADARQAFVQLLDTLVPYAALWIILVYLVKRQYPVALIAPLLFLASLFLVRIFIIFHDCTHNSFFDSLWANKILGRVTGILTFTPFTSWQHNHLVHHGTYADLDQRGVGDIWTLTVEEYLALPRKTQLAYRLYRHPLVFLGIGPGYSFLVAQRVFNLWDGRNERRSTTVTNIVMAGVLVAASLLIGLGTLLKILVPILLMAGAIGVWLFYVQHQFEGVYWSRRKEWDPVRAALEGSSYYKLPRVLQWISGNIGLHPVHHLLPRIPNYKLQEAFDASPVMKTVKVLTIRKSLRSFSLNLWDEKQKKLVSFRSLRGAARGQGGEEGRG